MNTLVRIVVLAILNSGILFTQDDKAVDITVHIENLDNNKGKLMVGLYNSEASFLKTQYMGAMSEIKNNRSTVTFKNIPAGTYSVSFIHDENENGKMDTNFMGIPKEDYGCSNNARGIMGPPKWKDAKFELKGENKTLTITL